MSTTLLLLFGVGLLFVADTISTMAILSKGGYERNPIVRRVMELIGRDAGLVVIKLAVFLSLYWQRGAIPLWLWWAIIVGYAAIVANNLVVLWRIGR